MSPDKIFPARTDDDLLLHTRFLIELAQMVVDDRHRLRRSRVERAERTCVRGLLLCERSRDLTVRLREIRAATEEKCRRSRWAVEQSEALMARAIRSIPAWN